MITTASATKATTSFGVFRSCQCSVATADLSAGYRIRYASIKRPDGGNEHHAGGDVLGILRQGMIFLRDHVHRRLDGSVQHLSDEDEHDRHAQEDKFAAGYVQEKTKDESSQRCKEMVAHMPLGLDGINDPFDRHICALHPVLWLHAASDFRSRCSFRFMRRASKRPCS